LKPTGRPRDAHTPPRNKNHQCRTRREHFDNITLVHSGYPTTLTTHGLIEQSSLSSTARQPRKPHLNDRIRNVANYDPRSPCPSCAQLLSIQEPNGWSTLLGPPDLFVPPQLCGGHGSWWRLSCLHRSGESKRRRDDFGRSIPSPASTLPGQQTPVLQQILSLVRPKDRGNRIRSQDPARRKRLGLLTRAH
jgi:hypothetical protein